MTGFREFVARVVWGPPGASFRLERVEQAGAETGRLTTPDGQICELDYYDWQRLAAAVQRIFPPVGGGGQSGKGKPKEGPENAGKPWTTAQDAELTQLWNKGADVRLLASYFGRARGGIASRLVRLGLVPDRETATSRPASIERITSQQGA